MNSHNQIIKFITEIPNASASYFDFLVRRSGRVLQMDLYRKSTDTQQYFQKSSCDPWHVKKAIPYGQALRMRRIY